MAVNQMAIIRMAPMKLAQKLFLAKVGKAITHADTYGRLITFLSFSRLTCVTKYFTHILHGNNFRCQFTNLIPMQQHAKSDVRCMIMHHVGFVHVCETATTGVVCLFSTADFETICSLYRDVFGYQFDAIFTVMLEYCPKTHDQKQYNTMATSIFTNENENVAFDDDDAASYKSNSSYLSTYLNNTKHDLWTFSDLHFEHPTSFFGFPANNVDALVYDLYDDVGRIASTALIASNDDGNNQIDCYNEKANTGRPSHTNWPLVSTLDSEINITETSSIDHKQKQTHVNDGIDLEMNGWVEQYDLGVLSDEIGPAAYLTNDVQAYCTMKLDMIWKIDCYSDNDDKDVHCTISNDAAEGNLTLHVNQAGAYNDVFCTAFNGTGMFSSQTMVTEYVIGVCELSKYYVDGYISVVQAYHWLRRISYYSFDFHPIFSIGGMHCNVVDITCSDSKENRDYIDQFNDTILRDQISILTDIYENVSFNDGDATRCNLNSSHETRNFDDVDIKCSELHKSQTHVSKVVHFKEKTPANLTQELLLAKLATDGRSGPETITHDDVTSSSYTKFDSVSMLPNDLGLHAIQLIFTDISGRLISLQSFSGLLRPTDYFVHFSHGSCYHASIIFAGSSLFFKLNWTCLFTCHAGSWLFMFMTFVINSTIGSMTDCTEKCTERRTDMAPNETEIRNHCDKIGCVTFRRFVQLGFVSLIPYCDHKLVMNDVVMGIAAIIKATKYVSRDVASTALGIICMPDNDVFYYATIKTVQQHETTIVNIRFTVSPSNDLDTTVGPDKLYYKLDYVRNINQNSLDQRKYNMMAASLMTDKYETVSFDDDDFTSYTSITELDQNVSLGVQIYCTKEIDMMNKKHYNVSIVHGNQQSRIDDGHYVKMNGVVVHDIIDVLSDEIGPTACSAVGSAFSEIGPGPVTHTNNVWDLPTSILLGCVLASDLTPFVSIIVIQFDDFDGGLNLHSRYVTQLNNQRDNTSPRWTTLFKLYDAFMNDVRITPEVCVTSILRRMATIIQPARISRIVSHESKEKKDDAFQSTVSANELEVGPRVIDHGVGFELIKSRMDLEDGIEIDPHEVGPEIVICDETGSDNGLTVVPDDNGQLEQHLVPVDKQTSPVATKSSADMCSALGFGSEGKTKVCYRIDAASEANDLHRKQDVIQAMTCTYEEAINQVTSISNNIVHSIILLGMLISDIETNDTTIMTECIEFTPV